MSTTEMIAAYRSLEGANVARMTGDTHNGTICVTYMNGHHQTYTTMQEVELAEKILRPSHMHTPILGALLFAIIGAPSTR